VIDNYVFNKKNKKIKNKNGMSKFLNTKISYANMSDITEV